MYGPIFKRETAISEQKFLDDIFFTQFLLSHASDNTTSRNIGEQMHGPSPHKHQILEGTVFPVTPKSPLMLVFFSIDSTNQTCIIYKNSCEQNLSDDVTQSYVIKMCVRKTNIGLIWVKTVVD